MHGRNRYTGSVHILGGEMKEIKLNKEIMRECIQEMNALKVEYSKVVCPELTGSGAAVAGIKQLTEIYKQFHESVDALMDETSRYLLQILHDFEEVDEGMANEMKKGAKS